jgi:enamine deaminase RidA (YjgF/YER057c/UK114 family)
LEREESLISGLLLTLLAADFQYIPAIQCSDLNACMDKLPKGKVVATTVFLADIADYGAMNKVYETYFPGLKPARNTIEVSLPHGIRMAINATLYTGPADPKGLTPPNVTNVVPITPGILTPDRLFIAGILGRDSNTNTIPTSPEAQIDMCLARLTRVLATAKLTPDAMLQATLYHSSAIPRALIDTKLKLYFGPQPSIAITILEASALALGANIGLNGIALFLPTGV